MKRIISHVLIYMLMISAIVGTGAIEKTNVYAEEDKSQTRYHLDIGVYVVAKANGKWVDGVQYNTEQEYMPSQLMFPTNIKVKRIMSLAQAQRENPNLWKETNFTNNIPIKKGENPYSAYQSLYADYIAPSISEHKIISNKDNTLQFSLKAQLRGKARDYNVVEKYEDRVTKTETVQQIVVKDNKTATAIKELTSERDLLYKAISGISSVGANEAQEKAYKRYQQVLKQLAALQSKPNYTTIDKVVESYKLDEQSFINEVYKFWGGPEGLKAVNGNMYQMMKNMEKGRVNLNDEYYLVFIPTVIEYEALKTCNVCGKCRLKDNCADTQCTSLSCAVFNTKECGCYTDPIEQAVAPADTTGNCTDVIKWSERQSHTYKCSGCKTKKSSNGTKKKYCPGHTCNHVYTYQSKLSTAATLKAVKPNGNSTTFKSGYGFTVNVNNSISTSQISNSGACGKSLSKANSKKPIPPELAEVRNNGTVKLKDSKYIQPKNVALSKSGGTATTSKFVTAPNPLSPKKNAQIYTDVALKGTKQKPISHKITAYTYGGGVNGVQFCKSIPLTFTINGNMYEDDWTVDGM